jgi:hypothetical protein
MVIHWFIFNWLKITIHWQSNCENGNLSAIPWWKDTNGTIAAIGDHSDNHGGLLVTMVIQWWPNCDNWAKTAISAIVTIESPMDNPYHQWINIVAIGRHWHPRLWSIILTLTSPSYGANISQYWRHLRWGAPLIMMCTSVAVGADGENSNCIGPFYRFLNDVTRNVASLICSNREKLRLLSAETQSETSKNVSNELKSKLYNKVVTNAWTAWVFHRGRFY